MMKHEALGGDVFSESSFRNFCIGLVFVFPDTLGSQQTYLTVPGTCVGISLHSLQGEPGLRNRAFNYSFLSRNI